MNVEAKLFGRGTSKVVCTDSVGKPSWMLMGPSNYRYFWASNPTHNGGNLCTASKGEYKCIGSSAISTQDYAECWGWYSPNVQKRVIRFPEYRYRARPAISLGYHSLILGLQSAETSLAPLLYSYHSVILGHRSAETSLVPLLYSFPLSMQARSLSTSELDDSW